MILPGLNTKRVSLGASYMYVLVKLSYELVRKYSTVKEENNTGTESSLAANIRQSRQH